ncbi:MAG: hypothetical protein HYT88_02170 [Candidatus Omnitrophica bacterium]|nr:hypothetical protein [Candidatus Omnitrophota bacterium]MBI3009460.1 hypothetical protein [Candidatus Omnitrophota bacterium]
MADRSPAAGGTEAPIPATRSMIFALAKIMESPPKNFSGRSNALISPFIISAYKRLGKRVRQEPS